MGVMGRRSKGRGSLSAASSPKTAPKLRFAVGDRVQCCVNDGDGSLVWSDGFIVKHWYRELKWPTHKWAPYQVKLAIDGALIYVPKDLDECVRIALPDEGEIQQLLSTMMKQEATVSKHQLESLQQACTNEFRELLGRINTLQTSLAESKEANSRAERETQQAKDSLQQMEERQRQAEYGLQTALAEAKEAERQGEREMQQANASLQNAEEGRRQAEQCKISVEKKLGQATKEQRKLSDQKRKVEGVRNQMEIEKNKAIQELTSAEEAQQRAEKAQQRAEAERAGIEQETKLAREDHERLKAEKEIADDALRIVRAETQHLRDEKERAYVARQQAEEARERAEEATQCAEAAKAQAEDDLRLGQEEQERLKFQKDLAVQAVGIIRSGKQHVENEKRKLQAERVRAYIAKEHAECECGWLMEWAQNLCLQSCADYQRLEYENHILQAGIIHAEEEKVSAYVAKQQAEHERERLSAIVKMVCDTVPAGLAEREQVEDENCQLQVHADLAEDMELMMHDELQDMQVEKIIAEAEKNVLDAITDSDKESDICQEEYEDIRIGLQDMSPMAPHGVRTIHLEISSHN